MLIGAGRGLWPALSDKCELVEGVVHYIKLGCWSGETFARLSFESGPTRPPGRPDKAASVDVS
jgi:hypothetical protein